MSSREGPAASVALSCYGCRHHARHGRGAAVRNACALRRQLHPWGAEWSGPAVPPDWCPHLPGPLVAIPVSNLTPGAAISDMHIDATRALGQEVTDA